MALASARHIARNSIVQLTGRGVTMAIAVVTLSLLSRYLGPYRFGQYQLVIAFLLLLNLSDFGVSTIAIRRLAASEGTNDQLIGNVLSVRTVFALASTVLAIAASFILDYSRETTLAIAIAALSFPLNVWAGGYNVVFAARLRMEYAVVSNVIQAVVTVVLIGVVALTGGGLVAMMIAYDAGFLANSIACVIFARKFVRPAFWFDAGMIRAMVKDAAPLGLSVLVISIYGRIDVVLLRAFTNTESVGYYTFAYRAVDLAAPLSLMFIGSVYPLLSNHHVAGELGDFRHLYQRSQDLLTVIGAGLLLLMVLFAHPAVDVVGGATYDPAVTSLRMLAFAFALIWLSNLVDYCLVAIGRQSVLLRIACLGLVVNLSANLMLIPAFGREGAAIATIITELAVLIPAIVVLARYLGGLPSFWVAGRVLPVATMAALVVHVISAPWLVGAAIAIGLYALGVAATRVVSLEDLRSIVRRGDRPDGFARARRLEMGASVD